MNQCKNLADIATVAYFTIGSDDFGTATAQIGTGVFHVHPHQYRGCHNTPVWFGDDCNIVRRTEWMVPAQESVDIINYVMVESRLVFLAKNGTIELIE